LVRNQVEIKDEAGQSINGNFSVSVSSDRYVTQDTTNNILTTLLLTSELRGHIENPAFYFQNTNAAQWALDLLMCTQGWRRYDIPEMLKGRFSRPSSPLEIGPEIAGTVKSVLIGRAIENVDVTILSFTGDYVEATTTDADGRFYFNNGELPDSTIFLVNVPANRGATRLEVIVDKETLPEITLPTFDLSIDLDDTQIARYANKADQQYLIEHGMRTYQISEVSITAERRPPRRSSYYSSPNSSITEAELERIPATDIRSLLMRLPGVMVSGNSITISNMGTPMLLIDDLPYDIADIEHINVHDIAQIDVLRDPSNTAMFGSRGVNGVIAVFTKDGSVTRTSRAVFNIKSFSPLGYQKTVEFYAPKYATAQSRNAQTPDLRTTIHWEPVVQTDSVGVAKFEFYTSDDTSSYTVIIEGITDCGKIIWQRGKLWRRD
jgi:TonB-dependent SusC/RagA subfamily outer membrane receptor